MDGKERKPRSIVWKGRVVEFSCSDDEFPNLSRDDGFLGLLCDEQRTQKGGLKLAASRSEAEVAAMGAAELPQAVRTPRRLAWGGNTFEVPLSDEAFAKYAADPDSLETLWYLTEAKRIVDAETQASPE